VLDCISVVYLVRNKTEWFAIASQYNPINRTHVQVTFWISKNLCFVRLSKCSLFIIKHNGVVSIKNQTFSLGASMKYWNSDSCALSPVLYGLRNEKGIWVFWMNVTNLCKKDMSYLQGKQYLLRQGRMILIDQLLSYHGGHRPGWVTEWQCSKASVFI
jgi:hypothetical protein